MEIKKKATAEYFLRNKGFPGIIGCIDGTHIVIDPPKHNSDEYIDRKGNTSICLQAICDEKKKFTDIFIRFPGSTHGSHMFKNSLAYPKLFTCKDYYLLGDSAYPCLRTLLTPYKDNGHLTRAQKKFSINLSSCRVYIEHSFGILKQRFGQLYYCKLRGMEILCHFIRACCVLHNLTDNDDFESNLENVSESDEGTEVLESFNKRVEKN